MRGQRIQQVKTGSSTVSLWTKSFASTSSAQNEKESCENSKATRTGEDLAHDLLSASSDTCQVVQQRCPERMTQTSLDPCSPLAPRYSPHGLRSPGNCDDLRPGLGKEATILGSPLETAGGSLPSTASRSRSREIIPVARSQPDGHLTSIFCCGPAQKDHLYITRSRSREPPSATENLMEGRIHNVSNSNENERGRVPVQHEADGAIPAAGFR